MIYDEICKHVTENDCFGMEEYILKDGQTVGISSGIRYLISFEPQSEEEIFKALQRFYEADFGTMFKSEYEKAFAPTQWDDGKAFGEYEIESLNEPIYIHYEPYGMAYNVVIYLGFEGEM